MTDIFHEGSHGVLRFPFGLELPDLVVCIHVSEQIAIRKGKASPGPIRMIELWTFPKK